MCALFLSLSEDTVKNSTIYHARTHTHTQRERERESESLAAPAASSSSRNVIQRSIDRLRCGFLWRVLSFCPNLTKKRYPAFFLLVFFA